MLGPSAAISPSVTLRRCGRLCHRSVAAQRLRRQTSDLWVKPGDGTLSVSADGEGGGCWDRGWITGKRRGLVEMELWMAVCRETWWAEWAEKYQTRWRHRGRWSGKRRRKTDGCTDKQGGGGGVGPRVAHGEQRSNAHRAPWLLFCCHLRGSRRQILEPFMLTGQ